MIDPDDLQISGMGSTEIRELIFSLYDFVAEKEVTNIFFIRERFPVFRRSEAMKIIHAMASDGILKYCSKGIGVGRDPNITLVKDEQPLDESIESEHREKNYTNDFQPDSTEESEKEDYMLLLEQMEDRISKHLRSKSQPGYEDEIVSKILSMRMSADKEILTRCFINLEDVVEICDSSNRAEKTIHNFCSSFECNPVDVEYYTTYDIPSNFFIYLFDRSPAYYRLLTLKYDSGNKSPEVILDGDHPIYVNKNPNSQEKVCIKERFKDFIVSYIISNPDIPQNIAFIEAYLFMFNNYLVSSEYLEKWYYSLFSEIDDLVYERNALNEPNIFDKFLVSFKSVKYIGPTDVLHLISFIKSTNEAEYAVTPEKLFNKYNEIRYYYIDDVEEFKQFIKKYCSFKCERGYICFNESLVESITNYILDKKNYDKEKVAKMYSRRYGGSPSIVSDVLRSIDLSTFFEEEELSKENLEVLEKELKDYEWVSAINAESIFVDKCELAEFFNNYNMHKLGFSREGDVYFRNKYPNFRECLRSNEFSREDIYVDHSFKIKKESESFLKELNYFITNLMWIPVSESRYINLRSERFEKLYMSMKNYVALVKEMCRDRFVTPHMLKKINVGIDEIDNDDYDLLFYDAILQATKVNRSSILNQHFYYLSTISSEYRCVAPDFLRYIVGNNSNSGEVFELKEILKSDYGIDVPSSNIRQLLSASDCVFSRETDTAYFDSDTFKEAVKND